ncbi:S8 family peptidase [Paenibacillus glycanilyticus]|uniref:S8 family peptidase n=1 Tax=Paenibacillus glycanilyticus TaxID=126569 RepID=UPI00190FE622|nr:S8 family peptidase [Paenibacillus glycanilyticus]
MNARKWVGLCAIIALVAIVVPGTRYIFNDRKAPESEVRNFSAHQEKTLKVKTLNKDMDATALLCTTECSKEFRKLMNSDTKKGAMKAQSDKVAHLMNMHKHMVYISWINGNRSVDRGALPDKTAAQYVEEAKAKVKASQPYHSKPFMSETGSRYMVLGVPSGKNNGIGVVGVINQDIVMQVERHQKRNLRLVPYPAEGNYRVESVEPNTNRETTVRDGEDNGNASHYHVKDVVVHFQDKLTNQQLEQIKQKINAEKIQRVGDTYVFRSKNMDADRMVHYFQKSWKTEYVEPHYLYLTNETAASDNTADIITPNDALYSQYQWNLPSIETEKGWGLSKGNDKVIVAILDTGVQADHPDLKGKLLNGTNIVDTNAAPNDDVGHGTHVAGIIGATVNNGEGVAGISWYNKIMPVKVLDSSGAGSTYSVAQGIIWATDHGAKVINMSLGNYAQAEFLHDAIKYAYDHDVVMVAASGNDNTDRPGYPAAYPEVFAVAATDASKNKASFSNFGDYIDVAAPGDSIASTYPGSQYAALSGTSMASPHVAALAGLIRSINPDLNNEEVMDIMRKSAIDLGNKGKDNYFGYGLIDVDKALKVASNYTTALQNFPSQTERRLEAISRRYSAGS